MGETAILRKVRTRGTRDQEAMSMPPKRVLNLGVPDHWSGPASVSSHFLMATIAGLALSSALWTM
jgi:hypothetical protein